ncbi:PREDICTED: zinc finger BED domain-containing protein RICESLEEPER 3-like isoform X1 [Lupinus angustifolius]|uniref:zinc finger BED domain-containing protein RICESLEEPER 3-like isoform X1 n=1 Tax=Lupinus angustifolius TaxID=3871 RepID=UPI00092F4DE6|nr:PREDICTED: zinc finger BED domain-containing protein RICESLEEPER 3-like isoform X1 [Lupinus angustifolius]
MTTRSHGHNKDKPPTTHNDGNCDLIQRRQRSRSSQQVDSADIVVPETTQTSDPNDMNAIDNDVHPTSNASTNKKRSRSTRAKCWNFFTILEELPDGVKRVECNACNAQYKADGNKYGTHSMTRHLDDCPKTKFEDVGQMMIDGQGKLKSHTIDQLVSRDMCAAAIIEHDLPFKSVEYRKIRAWLKYLNPYYAHISRNTAKTDVLKVYKREKEKL